MVKTVGLTKPPTVQTDLLVFFASFFTTNFQLSLNTRLVWLRANVVEIICKFQVFERKVAMTGEFTVFVQREGDTSERNLCVLLACCTCFCHTGSWWKFKDKGKEGFLVNTCFELCFSPVSPFKVQYYAARAELKKKAPSQSWLWCQGRRKKMENIFQCIIHIAYLDIEYFFLE